MFTELKRKINRNRKAYHALGRIFAIYRNTIMNGARLLCGIDKKTVVFSSFNYANYNDNPRYISEALHELAPDLRIVWLFRDGEDARKRIEIPDYIQIYNSIENKGVIAMARSKVVVDNFNKKFYLSFPGKKQCYIQTWHGDRAFKKVGVDDSRNFNHGIERKAQLCIAGSDYGERQYRSAFEYRGEVLKIGTPRNDILVRNDPAECAEIRRKLNIPDEVKVLLYAPTYRDTCQRAQKAQSSSIDLSRALDQLEKNTNCKWICLIRAHYLSHGIDGCAEDERLRSATDHQEMGDLMLISDALITDYSSCAGDYALMLRPIYLYQDDLEDYVNNSRNLYFKMEDSPYRVAHNREELDELIRTTTPEDAARNCRDILDFYGTHENGHAAETVARYILEQLK